jgi:hypothetical protein
MNRYRLILTLVIVAATACTHKPASESPPVAADRTTQASCSKAAIDSLAPARQDSARIACNGYQFQVGRPPRKP